MSEIEHQPVDTAAEPAPAGEESSHAAHTKAVTGAVKKVGKNAWTSKLKTMMKRFSKKNKTTAHGHGHGHGHGDGGAAEEEAPAEPAPEEPAV